MQFDLFHIYTVDEHALFVVRYMRKFSFPETESDKIALVPHVIENIPKLELLYIAGLFHDIAKGRNGDHSQLGADDVAQFCQKHGLSNFDTHLVASPVVVQGDFFFAKSLSEKKISADQK